MEKRSLNRPENELTPEFGQISRGSMKKYQTELKREVVNSFLAVEGGAKLLS